MCTIGPYSNLFMKCQIFTFFFLYFLSIIWILEDNISSLAPSGLLFNIQWWKSDNSYCVKHIIKNRKWMSSFNLEKYLSTKIWFLRIIFCFRNIKNKNFTLLILALVSAVGWYRLHSFGFWLIPTTRVVTRAEIKTTVRYFI